jgi:tripartite-type tricarboxylate transporter receptor subunit TctC
MRTLLRTLLTLATTLAACLAGAQDYPHRPLKLVIPYAPAGSTDVVGRLVAQKLSEALKQPVVLENRPGDGGVIGVRSAVRSPPDGYTLVLSGSAMANLAVFRSDLGFDPIADLANVATLAEVPIAIAAGNGTPFRTLADLATAAKARPGSLSFGTPGLGTSAHLACETLKLQLGIDLLHVPYKGNGPAANDLLGGHIPLLCSNLAGLPDLKGERLRILGVTGTARDPSAPQAPTFRESGVSGMDRGTWMALSMPAQTPVPILQRLNTEVAKILQMPEVVERLRAAGALPMISTREDFAERLEQVRRDLADLKKSTGLKIE